MNLREVRCASLRRSIALLVSSLLLGAGLAEVALAVTPTVSVSDASTLETNAGTTTLNVPLTRAGDTTEGIAVTYRTDDSPASPATADVDYVSITSANALLPAGATTMNLPIGVKGDTAIEPNEQFFVHLLSATNVGPTPDFGAAANFGSGAGALATAVADLNGDGRLDVAVANQSGNTVSVLLNNTIPGSASASFSLAANLGAGSLPCAVATGDLNGDGRPDLVVGNTVSNNVSILLNTTSTVAGGVSFAAPANFVVGTTPFGVVIGDLNGDGRPDVAAANNNSNSVSVLLNTISPGGAMASFAPASTFGVGAAPRAIAIGDINGDGKQDLATANQVDASVSVLLNTTLAGGSGASFASAAHFSVRGATSTNPFSVAIGDLNGDGRPDLAVADTNRGIALVLLNTAFAGSSSASFATPTSFNVGGSPRSVAIGDLNGDGRPDLAVGNRDGNTVSVLLNIMIPGAILARFAPAANFGTGTRPHSLSLADFNGDGQPDLTLANQGSGDVSVLFKEGLNKSR